MDVSNRTDSRRAALGYNANLDSRCFTLFVNRAMTGRGTFYNISCIDLTTYLTL